MPALKSKQPAAEQQQKKYPAKRLLDSKLLAGYQRDFAGVILGTGTYTVQEAKGILDQALKSGADKDKKKGEDAKA